MSAIPEELSIMLKLLLIIGLYFGLLIWIAGIPDEENQRRTRPRFNPKNSKEN
jgi:hypothetical protein